MLYQNQKKRNITNKILHEIKILLGRQITLITSCKTTSSDSPILQQLMAIFYGPLQPLTLDKQITEW